MKLKVQHVFDATLVVAQIIRENRPMPQKGKYRLARLHAKLLPEFTTAAARRDEIITAYDHHEMMPGEPGLYTASDPPQRVMISAPQFSVPPDKLPEFNAAWAEIAGEEIEVDVEPVPLGCLDLGDNADGAIQAAELVTLGDLVTE